jgi:bifunctional non-homologous end joining protein LigD
MLLRTPSQKSQFIEPCRPSKAIKPPSGPLWVHEIKHDGFRLMVRREGSRVRCFTRGGYDWAARFPAIVEAASRIKAQSFLIDGEVVVCRDDGLSDFKALHSRRRDHDAVLFAFDLIEHQGEDLRNAPLLDRKRQLAKLLGRAKDGIQFNEHLAHDGPAVFDHACRLGVEGIVSKRIDAPIAAGGQRRG